jgi:predicted phosphodiesterase
MSASPKRPALIPLTILAIWACSCAIASTRPGPASPASSAIIGPYVKAVGPHELTICWETAKRVPTLLRWGITPQCAETYEDTRPLKRHEATLASLEPGTVYWYSLDAAGSPASAVTVRTQAIGAAQVRIAVLGDTHSALNSAHEQNAADILADKPDFVLHTGDLSVGRTESRLQDFFLVEAPVLRSVPIYPARGNHDGSGARFTQLFLPKQDHRPATYYSVRWGAVAVIALDTNQSVAEGSAQWRWLSSTLAVLAGDPGVAFKLVEMHWGPFDSGSGHGSNLKVRAAMVPLFERYGVDIVLSGHDHVFERSTVKGIKYVVTGGGGGGGGKYGYKRHLVMGSWWTEAQASDFHHCLLEIAGNTLHFTAREAGTGRVLDQFVLDKGIQSGERAR